MVLVYRIIYKEAGFLIFQSYQKKHNNNVALDTYFAITKALFSYAVFKQKQLRQPKNTNQEMHG